MKKSALCRFLNGPGASQLLGLHVGIEKVEYIFEELCSEKIRDLYCACKARFPSVIINP
jgi:hypothetical protein